MGMRVITKAFQSGRQEPGLFVAMRLKEFVEESMCGKIDIYFCGHDHNRQWLEPTCGTEFVVSGAAAKLTDLEGRGSPTFYEDDLQPGFMLVEIQDNRLRGEFYDQYGNLDFFREVIK